MCIYNIYAPLCRCKSEYACVNARVGNIVVICECALCESCGVRQSNCDAAISLALPNPLTSPTSMCNTHTRLHETERLLRGLSTDCVGCTPYVDTCRSLAHIFHTTGPSDVRTNSREKCAAYDGIIPLIQDIQVYRRNCIFHTMINECICGKT